MRGFCTERRLLNLIWSLTNKQESDRKGECDEQREKSKKPSHAPVLIIASLTRGCTATDSREGANVMAGAWGWDGPAAVTRRRRAVGVGRLPKSAKS
jgi:hypothetical protein